MVISILLNTGFLIPLLGLGTGRFRTPELVNNVFDNALDVGYRLFDSAIVYKNEELIGNALKTLLPKYNLTRENVFLTTKYEPFVNHTETDVENMVKESLRKFQSDYIDLYLIHEPRDPELGPNDPRNKELRLMTWRVLTKLKRQGLIRSIGVSNYAIKHLAELVDDPNYENPAVNQVEWHLYNHDPALLEYCREKGIFLQAFSPLGTWFSSELREDPTVAQIARKLGKSPSQVLLRWSYQRNIGTIPKATSRAHLEENFNIDFEIPDEDMKILSDFEIKKRYDIDPNAIA